MFQGTYPMRRRGDHFQFWFRSLMMLGITLAVGGIIGLFSREEELLQATAIQSIKLSSLDAQLQEIKLQLAALPQMQEKLGYLQMQVNANKGDIKELQSRPRK